jgi:hypothetical protein
MTASTRILEDLHTTLAEELLRRIKAGDESPALLNVARQFLRDNGVEGLPVADSALSELIQAMPSFYEESEECKDPQIFTH